VSGVSALVMSSVWKSYRNSMLWIVSHNYCIYFVFFSRVVLTGPGSQTVGAHWHQSRGRFSSWRNLPVRTSVDCYPCCIDLTAQTWLNLIQCHADPSFDC